MSAVLIPLVDVDVAGAAFFPATFIPTLFSPNASAANK